MVESAPYIHEPLPLAMVICDQTYRDPATGKFTLNGCFSSIYAKKFPAMHPGLSVYIALTDIHGRTPIKVQMVDVDEEREPIFEATGECRASSPKAIVETALGVPAIEIPQAGEYRIQFFAGNIPLLERNIYVVEIREEAQGEAKP